MEEAQMLHPALARALATAEVEDRHRAALARQTIRLARRVAHEPHVAARPVAIVRSASTRLRARRAPQADGIVETWLGVEDDHSVVVELQFRHERGR